VQPLLAALQVLSEVRLHRHRRGFLAVPEHPLEIFFGQQVVVEVAVAAAARHPHVAAPEAVLELREGGEFVVAAVYLSLGADDVACSGGPSTGYEGTLHQECGSVLVIRATIPGQAVVPLVGGKER